MLRGCLGIGCLLLVLGACGGRVGHAGRGTVDTPGDAGQGTAGTAAETGPRTAGSATTTAPGAGTLGAAAAGAPVSEAPSNATGGATSNATGGAVNRAAGGTLDAGGSSAAGDAGGSGAAGAPSHGVAGGTAGTAGSAGAIGQPANTSVLCSGEDACGGWSPDPTCPSTMPDDGSPCALEKGTNCTYCDGPPESWTRDPQGGSVYHDAYCGEETWDVSLWVGCEVDGPGYW